MFDEIVCEVALPDGDFPPGTCFQTKSFPDPCIFRYRITREGRMIDSAGNDIEPDGYISFYTTETKKWIGSRQSDAVTWREYRAHFASGQLQSIVRVHGMAKDNRRFGLASFRWFECPSFVFGDPDDD